MRPSSPDTAAGPHPIHTGFPIIPRPDQFSGRGTGALNNDNPRKYINKVLTRKKAKKHPEYSALILTSNRFPARLFQHTQHSPVFRSIFTPHMAGIDQGSHKGFLKMGIVNDKMEVHRLLRSY